MSSLKQISTAIMLYSGDYDDVLPKAEASSQLEAPVLPYVKNRAVFAASPEAGRVLYNTHLSGVNITSLEVPTETVLLWEERAWSDGKRAVAFADGHVKRLDEIAWSKVWKDELRRRAEKSARAKAAPRGSLTPKRPGARWKRRGAERC